MFNGSDNGLTTAFDRRVDVRELERCKDKLDTVFPTVPGTLQCPGGLVVPGAQGTVGKDPRHEPFFRKDSHHKG